MKLQIMKVFLIDIFCVRVRASWTMTAPQQVPDNMSISPLPSFLPSLSLPNGRREATKERPPLISSAHCFQGTQQCIHHWIISCYPPSHSCACPSSNLTARSINIAFYCVSAVFVIPLTTALSYYLGNYSEVPIFHS